MRLAEAIERFDAHVAAHGAYVPEPYLGLRLLAIAAAWSLLFLAGYVLDLPATVALATLVAVPLMLLPELACALLRRRLRLSPKAARQRRALEKDLSIHHRNAVRAADGRD